MSRVAILDDYQQVARDMADWSVLRDQVEVVFFHDHLADRDRLVERLAPFEIIGAMRERTPFPAGLLERLPNLKLLVTTGKVNAAIDLEAAARQGVTVCGTGSPGHATAELAFGLILTLARGLVRETASMREGGWQVGLGRDLQGAVLGVLGLGRLGARVAGFGKAFGMDVLAWSQNLDKARAAEVGVRSVGRDELFAASDFLTIHLRLSERTRGLVGARELGLMRPEACLVNTSRGPIVDEQALLKALRGGGIGGAALDVYDQEPLPPAHPLRSAPNLVLTPHIGYVTRATYRVFYGEMVKVIRAFLDGRPQNVLTAPGG